MNLASFDSYSHRGGLCIVGIVLLYKSSTKNIFTQVVIHVVPVLVITLLLCKTGLLPVKARFFSASLFGNGKVP